MLQAVDFLPDGTRVASELGLRDTQRALEAIDPNMRLCVDLETGMFDVWTLDAHQRPFIAVSRPYADARLIRDVQAADTRYRDVAGEARLANIAREAEVQATFDEQVEAYADKLLFALRRDLGHLEGGRSRLVSVGGLP